MAVQWPDEWAFDNRRGEFPYPFGVLRRLEAAALSGAMGAAVDGLLLCREARVQPPDWAIYLLAGTAAGHFPNVATGPMKAPFDVHRKNIIHRLRWYAVKWVAKVRDDRKEERSDGFEIGRFPGALIQGNRYEVAADILIRTPVFASW